MAQYIKFNLSTPGAGGSELLIEVADVLRIVTASTTTTDVFLKNPLNATRKWTITHTVPLVVNSILDAINAALTANPGGIVSTVTPSINQAQAPLAQSGARPLGQGRIVITAPQIQVVFASAAYTA